MLIPCNFYEKNIFKIPEISSESKLPSSHQGFLNKVEKIVLDYIDNSELISEDDKELCKDSIRNVSIHYAKFIEDYYKNIAMVTNGSDIYVNSNFKDYISEYLYLHEFIHVISNTTNVSSKYEFSSYRSSNINEAITDLIAINLAQKNNLSDYSVSAYQTYYEFAYYAISRFDKLLKAYYYSDLYDDIISSVGQDQWDLFILLVDNFGDGKSDSVIYYLLNGWFK